MNIIKVCYEKAFGQSCNIQRHEQTHTGETPCECEHCDEAFCYSSSICKYESIHAGEKFINVKNVIKSALLLVTLKTINPLTYIYLLSKETQGYPSHPSIQQSPAILGEKAP